MFGSRKVGPSAGVVLATIALVVALGGGAVAGVAVTSLDRKEKKQVKRIAKKEGKRQANRQIAKKESSLDVATAQTAVSADTAAQADAATTAVSAQDADTANGLRPVALDFAAPADTPATPLLEISGLRIDAECTAGGVAALKFESLADDGVIGPGSSGVDGDFDDGETKTTAGSGVRTFAFRGADGTVLSGQVVQADTTAVGQCVMSGTALYG